MSIIAYSGRYYESNLFTSSLIPYFGSLAFIIHALIVISFIYFMSISPITKIEFIKGVSAYSSTFYLVLVQYMYHNIISYNMLF